MRLSEGLFGDAPSVGDGVRELRIIMDRASAFIFNNAAAR
jgi:putative component of toxin-antitoxin plasmid stabilization module